MATVIVFCGMIISYCISPEYNQEFMNTLLDTHGKYIVVFAVIYDLITLWGRE